MERLPYLLHALSPLHAGTGQAVDIVDLPIARMESTRIPLVPGSSIKGVLRDDARTRLSVDATKAVFGPDRGQDASEHAGALVASDARLLALPVRSFKSVFVWVTSPLLLALAHRDLEGLAQLPCAPAPHATRRAHVSSTDCLHKGKLYLADLDLAAQVNDDATTWAGLLAPHVWHDRPELLTKRLAIVDDDTMAYLWDTATQVDARVSIHAESCTVTTGALWYEESLPPETLLLGLLLASRSFNPKHSASASEVLRDALPAATEMQFGGKASVGRGRCRLVPLAGAAAGGAR